jgi:hypothetical protein
MTPSDKKVDILVELLEDRFYARTGNYASYFWEATAEGMVCAKLVKEGVVSIVSVIDQIQYAWSELCHHWCGHQSIDFGFSSLAEMEADETYERAQAEGLLDPP